MGLPRNRSKTLTITRVFTILLSIFIPGCTQRNMTQKTQDTSVTGTSDPISIHRQAIAIDMHVDTAQRLLDEHVEIQQQLSELLVAGAE